MAEKQTVKDDGSLDKYAAIIPHMADDDLDPHQYRLYGHYKRLWSEKGGCDESVRDTAKITRMSSYAVQKSRDELAALGYIEVVKPTKEEARKGKTVHVTLIDRWAENVSRYAKAVSNLTQPTNEAVSKLIQVDEKAVSNSTHANVLPVSKLTRSTYGSKEIERDSQPDPIKPVIATWLSVLKELAAPPDGNPYANKTLRKIAGELVEAGRTCDDIERYMRSQYKDTFWKKKLMTLQHIQQHMPAWLAANPVKPVIQFVVDGELKYPDTSDYLKFDENGKYVGHGSDKAVGE